MTDRKNCCSIQPQSPAREIVIGVLDPITVSAAHQGVRISKTGPFVEIASTLHQPVSVRLTDVAGRSVCARELPAFGALRVGTESLKSGFCLVQINGAKVKLVQPLMMMK